MNSLYILVFGYLSGVACVAIFLLLNKYASIHRLATWVTLALVGWVASPLLLLIVFTWKMAGWLEKNW